jgi:hypothetical protein
MFTELAKKSTLGAFSKLNLNPVGDKKFLFLISLSHLDSPLSLTMELNTVHISI